MSLFNYFKVESPIINALLSTFALALMSYFVKVLQTFDLQNFDFFSFNLKYFFYKKNIVILEGKKSTYSSGYERNIFVSSLYSDRFNATWNHIIKNIETNKTIYEIKEIYGSGASNWESKELKDYQKELFLVSQEKEFLVDKELKIFAITKTHTENQEDKEGSNNKNPSKIDKFIITLFSYENNIDSIKKFIDNITDSYLKNIENERCNKKFIYTLMNAKCEENKYECWSECTFKSSKTFKNTFFKKKEDIIDKLNFFINNEKWYYDMGIPHTIGIGLHGPPGTGKTSVIKCIANMLNRHVINLSLKIIKTKKQLNDFFFEDKYNHANKKGSLGFNNKIIVIEDIDCIGEIVSKRENKNLVKNNRKKSNIQLDSLTAESNVNVGKVIKSLTEKNNEETLKMYKLLTDDEPITLDDILNLWDGLRETPGRVLIISSNYYGELDPALIRPGRIDVTLEMGNPDHEVIGQLYEHLTKKKIPEKKLKKITPNFYSQAEIINIFLACNKNTEVFIERLLLNTK